MNNKLSFINGVQGQEDAYTRYRRENGLLDEQQPEEQPGFLESAWQGAKAQGAGVIGGQADMFNLYTGIGKDTADYMQKVQQDNARKKEYSWGEMVPFASDYWTNPQGAAYDIGGGLGSSAALMGETLAAGALGSAAGFGGIGTSIAGAIGTRAAAAGLPWVSKVMSTPAGKALMANIMSTPFEAVSEGGNKAREIKEAGGSESEQKTGALKSTGLNMALLSFTNTLESAGLGKLIGQAGGKDKFMQAMKGVVGDAVQNAYEEGAQTTIGEYVDNPNKGALSIVNPLAWSEDARNAAAVGGVTGAAMGGGAVVGGKAINEVLGKTDEAAETLTNEESADNENTDADEKERFINAIAGQESGGDYDAVNERTGASGKYQIMPENWPQWAEEAGLGADAEMTPENQETVARYKLGEYYDKYGARGAAVAWYGGEGALDYDDDALNRKQGNGDEPSINEYADSVMQRMGDSSATDSEAEQTDEQADEDYNEENETFEQQEDKKPFEDVDLGKDNKAQDLKEEPAEVDYEETADYLGANPRASYGVNNEGQENYVNTQRLGDKRIQNSPIAFGKYNDKRKFLQLIDKVRNNRAAQKQRALDYAWYMKEHERSQGTGKPVNDDVVQRALNDNKINMLTERAVGGNPAAQRAFEKMSPAVRQALLNRKADRLAQENEREAVKQYADVAKEPFMPQQYLNDRELFMNAYERQQQRKDIGAAREPFMPNAAYTRMNNPQAQSYYNGQTARALAAQNTVQGEQMPSVAPTANDAASFLRGKDAQTFREQTLPQIRQRYNDAQAKGRAGRQAQLLAPNSSVQKLADPRVREWAKEHTEKKTLNQWAKDLKAEILSQHSKRAIQACQEALRDAKNDYKSLLEPIVTKMEKGMGNGVSVLWVDDNGNPTTEEYAQRGIRASNNMPWYSKYYKENKAKPSKEKLYDIARDIYLGKNEYGVEGESWYDGSPEAVAELADRREQVKYFDTLIAAYEKVLAELKGEKQDGKNNNQAAQERTEGKHNDENAVSGRSTEKQADNVREDQNGKAERVENKKAPALAEGYTTESGRALSEADEQEFILHKGKINLGEISQSISQATNNALKAAPIRLQVGNAEFGLKHLLKHENDMKSKGFTNVYAFVDYVIKNFNQVYSQQSANKPNRFVLYCKGDNSKGFMPIDLELKKDTKGYYTIVSAMPHKEKIKGTLIYDGSSRPSTATTNSLLSSDTNNKGGDDAEIVLAKSNVPLSDNSISQKPQESKTQEPVSDKEKPQDAVTDAPKVEFTLRDELNGIEVKFNEKPSAEILQKLKAAGYRWSNRKKMWYAHRSPKAMALAESLGYKGNNASDTASEGNAKTVAKEQEQAVTEKHQKSEAVEFKSDNEQQPSPKVDAYTFKNNPEALLNQQALDNLTPSQMDMINDMFERGEKSSASSTESTPAAAKPQRFDGERAKKSLDALIGRKKKAEPQQNDVIPKLVNVFNEDELDAEIAKAKAEINKLSANPMFNPVLMKSLFKIGGIYLQKGVNKFAAWAQNMVDVMGESVRPFLPAVWSSLKKYPQGQKFNDDVMSAVMEYVGDGVDQGKSLSAIKREFADDYGEDYLGYVDAAYEGVKEYPTEIADNVVKSNTEETTKEAKEDGTIVRRETARADSDAAGARPDTGRSGLGGSVSAPQTQGDAGAGAAERGVSAQVTEKKLTPAQKKGAKAKEVPGHNFTITEEENIGKGGPKAKYKDNVEAIRLLKQLEAENRLATPEEQKVLARYVGWGGLSPVFNTYGRGAEQWKNEQRELQELLTSEEYNAARASTNNAHYTSPEVIKGVWDIVGRLGFKGGRVLEPSMGIGNFYGMMPETMRSKSALNGVELDSITGRIARQLYQKANVEISGFEQTKYPDNFFDLVVSNVPFGDYKLNDPKYNKYKFNIHNYFFSKAVDQTRPGGLVCFITSTGTMQSGADSLRLRQLLQNKVDFIGALRLPNTAFKENAGTDVTTDLIILQKRETGAEAGKNNQQWLNTVDSGVRSKYGDKALGINEYYSQHPEMMLGKLVEDKLYGGRLALDGTGVDIAAEMAKRVNSFPANIYKPLTGKRNLDSVESAKAAFLAPAKMRYNAYAEQGGKVYQNINGKMVELPQAEQKKALDYVALRDVTKEILAAQIDPATKDDSLKSLREKLNKVYDAFVAKHGYINDSKNVKALAADPEYGVIAAIEEYKYDKKTKVAEAKKRDIFTKRTVNAIVQVNKADNPADALALSLSNTGTVNVDYMAQLLGKKPQEVVKSLEGLIYENPATHAYETADEYLSGNVREKLEYAKEAAKQDKAFEKNVKELEKVQPKDIAPEEISVSLGTPWVPAADVEAFAAKLLDMYQPPFSIKFVPQLGSWTVSWNRGWTIDQAKRGTKNTTTWGTQRRDFKDILDDALNQRSPVIYDTDSQGNKTVNQKETTLAQQKIREVQNEFRKWIWSNKERTERLAAYYNRNYNNWRLREYNGSHLTMPGYSAVEAQLYPHQKDAIWRMMQRENTLLAHCVGAGKTWTMQAGAMEMKRLGIIKKPMFVIPNHMLQQFENEFRRIYPNAKLLTISSDTLPDVTIPNAKKLNKTELERRRAAKNAARQSTLGRIATEDWDGIIISHNMFKRIPMSDKAYADFYRDQIDEMREAIIALNSNNDQSSNRLVKELEKKAKSLEEKLKQAVNEENKDIVIPFEQLGVDQLFVDEADMFKNLFFVTKMTRIAGLSNTNSQRSTDMFMKTQYLTKTNGGRGVVFATGTPISNTMAEMFTMLRYLDMQGLKEKNMAFFDNWAANFANRETTIERSPDGQGYRQTEKFTSFTNMPELIKMFRKVADVKTQEDLHLDIPKLKNGKPTIVEIEPNDALTNYIKNVIADRADKIHNRRVDPSQDNMLKLTGDLRKASLDMRLVDPTVPAQVAESKLKAVADRTYDKYVETTDVQGAQLIFCDLSTPKAASDKVSESDTETKEAAEDGENVTAYEEIKKMLLKKGIPSKEIAFIHDAKTKEQKEELFAKVRAGDVRVLIGSTEKMGAGTNIQDKLVALHHVDAPWRPRDIEQREGRILRKGNQNKEVEIFNYVTKDSFDANMWEKLKNKAAMINQAMSNNLSGRTIEDADANVLTFAEVEALASGNPLMAERTMVSAELNKYETLHAAYTRAQAQAARKAEGLPIQIKQAELTIKQGKADIKKRTDITKDNFSITLGKNTYTNRADAKAALEKLVGSYKNELGGVVGKVGGFGLRLRLVKAGQLFSSNERTYRASEDAVRAELVGENIYNSEPSLQSIEYNVMHGPERVVDMAERSKSGLEKELADVTKELNKPFEYESKYNELKQRSAEIDKELGIGEDNAPKFSVSDEATAADSGENRTHYSAAAIGIPSTPLSRTLYQAAYHGSPHIFDEFSLEHIGEGEGAQAHGWGLYFAKEEATAQGYRDTLSVGLTGEISFIDPETGETVILDTEKPLTDLKISGVAQDIEEMLQRNDYFVSKAIGNYERRIREQETRIATLEKSKGKGATEEAIKAYKAQMAEIEAALFGGDNLLDEKAFRKLQRMKKPLTNDEIIEEIARLQKQVGDYEKAINALLDANVDGLKRAGASFEVDIPENDVLLDEQKPYNEQPDKVKTALLKMSKEIKGFGVLGKAIKDNADGRDLYRAVGADAFYNENNYEGGSSEAAIAASKALNKYGIKGITYDGQRDGRCFVIFDDTAIEIKRRYDEAIANNQSEMQRSYDEVLADAKAALPKGKFELLDSGDYLVAMPNGAKIRLSIKDRIVVNAKEEASARASHGLNKDSDIVIQGSWTKLYSSMLDGVLRVSQESKDTTAFHEAFHAVWDLALSEREKQALLKYYTSRAEKQGRDVYEVMADAYADWTVARREKRSSMFGKLWQKVQDFVRRLQKMFTGMDNLHDIMRRVETNEVWTRKVNKDNSSSGPRYSAVGEHGNITDKAKLEQAKTMESAGKSPEEIFDATGWWKGADSRWRFEIKDNLKAIDLSKLKSAAVKLQNIYTNDTLYEHYPELKNVPVRLADLGGAYGKMISGEIRIDKKLLKTSPDRAKETLLHEMQHVIQRIEGFARGGDPTTAIDRVYGLLRELKTNKLPTLYDRIHPSYGFWKSRLRAIEAREKDGNPKKTDTTQKPKLIAKIKEAEDTYEKKHGSKDIERINQYESNLEQAQWQIDEYDGLVKEMQEDGWDKYMAASIIDETAGGTFYQALLGEQEARATAQRATGKASKYPWQDLTHSYKNKSLIVYGDEASSTRVKKKADPDIIALNKKYKDKLVQAYAKGANNSEITAIMNAHQDELIKLFEQKKLEQKEKARVRATELRNLRKAFKNGEIDEYAVGGVTIKRGEDGQEVVDDVSENLTKRTYVNQRHAGKKYKNATEEIQDIVHRTERRGYIQKIRDWLKEQKDHFYRNWVDKNTDLNIFDKAYAAAVGKILDSADTILAKAQYITNNANGAVFSLVEGDLAHVKIAQQKYGFKHLVSFKMILDELVAKKDNYKDYMKKYYAGSANKGVQGYIDAFDNYIVARGLLEASQNHKLDYDREVADWAKNGSKGTQPVFKEYKLPGELTEEKLKEIIDDAPKEFNGLAKKYYQFNDNLLDIMEHSGLITKEQHAVLNGRYQSYCPLMRDFTDTAAVENFVGQLSSGKGIGNVSDPMKRRRSEGSARDIVSPLESTIKATANIIIKCERNKVGQTLVNRAKEAGLTDLVEQVEGTTGDAKNCIFTVWENGEKHAYRTTQELYPAVTQSFEPGLKLTWALMTKPAEILRAGSTSSPSFIIRNFLRDTIWAGVSSKNGFIPIVDSLRGAWALRHNKQLRAEFEASGVISSAFYNDAEAVRRSLDEMVGGKYETHGLLDILKALGKYPIDFLKFFGDNVEASTRMGEFMRARENGKSIEQSAVDAIEVTLNFNRSGVEGQQANRVVPFFNACIQGGDKLYRLMKEDPGGTMGRIGLYIMLPSLGLWLLNHDEDWYKELDPNIKATCWVLPGGIRIPKPQEAGILFGTGVEAMLDAAYEQDPKAVGNWVKTYLGDTMLPNFLPTVLLPIIEWQSNYSFFRGKPVVNATQQKLPDEMQYGPYTTEVAKIIGKTAAATPVGGISPVKIDNAWRSITGTMGMFLLQIPDFFAAEKQNLPKKKLTEMPIIRDFIVNEMNKNRTMNDFYALKDAADKQHRAYGKAGKPKKEVQSVSAAARLISQKRMEIRDIINSPRLNPMRKRELIDKKEQESKRIAQLCIKKYGKYFDY